MLIPYFLPNLGMGGGGTPIVYVTSAPFAAESSECAVAADGFCQCPASS